MGFFFVPLQLMSQISEANSHLIPFWKKGWPNLPNTNHILYIGIYDLRSWVTQDADLKKLIPKFVMQLMPMTRSFLLVFYFGTSLRVVHLIYALIPEAKQWTILQCFKPHVSSNKPFASQHLWAKVSCVSHQYPEWINNDPQLCGFEKATIFLLLFKKNQNKIINLGHPLPETNIFAPETDG